MYNIIKSLLINSVKRRKTFLTQLSHDRTVTSWKNYVNIQYLWSDVCKRFYSKIASNALSIENIECLNDTKAQEILDELRANPEDLQRIQIIELEMDNMRHDAEKIPNNIKPKNFLKLINMNRSQRRRFLAYLFANEKAEEHKKEQKKIKFAERQTQLQEENPDAMKYGLAYNTLFLRIYPKTMNHFYNSKLITAMMFEPKLVFDCGYESYMNNFEKHNCAKQLTIAFANNRAHISPMHIYFCNVNQDGTLLHYLKRNVPTILDDDFPAEITSQSYLDLFPKDQLIYLTSHSNTYLQEYDPDKVYIIGAIVDKSNPQPFSLAKAKKEGICMAKLPLSKHLSWGSGSTKNLTLNQMICIMLDLNHTKNWNKALQHVPVRKLKPFREYQSMMKTKQFISNQTRADDNSSEIELPMNFTFANRKNK